MNGEKKILSLLEILIVDVKLLKEDVSSLNKRIGNLEAGHSKLEEDICVVRQTVARIEIEHAQMLEALNDGYKMLSEKIEENKKFAKRVDILEDQMKAVNMKLAGK